MPVYNAANFVTQAIESALQQPETEEVILVEDGSGDGSWEICRLLAEKYHKVSLFSHPGRENRGAGASRNLGMKKSSCEFIAFLDSDDYYLPSRFAVAKQVFEADPNCEGVYEAIGLDMEDADGLQRLVDSRRRIKDLHTVTKRVEHDNLWRLLISGEFGDFHLNGFVLRKSILARSGYMAENLKLHQDTNFIIRAAIVAKLLPGRLDEPVAMWRAHVNNRISAPRSESRKYLDSMQFWMETFRWSKNYQGEEVQKLILEKMITVTMSSRHFFYVNLRYMPATLIRAARLLLWFVQYPGILIDPLFKQEIKPLRLWKMVRAQSF